jgi:SAM-dependent methyltransferase
MKNLIKKILYSPANAKMIVRMLVKIHQLSYAYLGAFASAAEGGIHPKHRIVKYKEWFLENIEPQWSVLDVGCNTGLMPHLLSEKAAFVYGIEIDESKIQEAKTKRQRQNIEYICADATTYDFGNRKIDCVTLSNVLEHIEDRVGFLKKLVANLKWEDSKNKRFLMRVPMIDREWLVPYKQELGIEWRLDRTHKIEYTEDEFYKELIEAGLKVSEIKFKWGEIWAVAAVNNIDI